jgi:hypothetical protein
MTYVRKTRDEFDLEADYGYGQGWEVETSESTWTEARAQLRTYRDNGVFVPMRIVKRRVKIEREQVFKELRADKRYTVDPEFTGRTTRCWVARFCGEWLSRHDQQWQA